MAKRRANGQNRANSPKLQASVNPNHKLAGTIDSSYSSETIFDV
jgi:hypothetical protein